jgi:hypothetical protein
LYAGAIVAAQRVEHYRDGIVKLARSEQTEQMKTNLPSYRGYRFPPDIISHAVWLYHRFCLSFRDVEDLLAQRGITVSYETIRQWCRKWDRIRPDAQADARGAWATPGTWMNCS